MKITKLCKCCRVARSVYNQLTSLWITERCMVISDLDSSQFHSKHVHKFGAVTQSSRGATKRMFKTYFVLQFQAVEQVPNRSTLLHNRIQLFQIWSYLISNDLSDVLPSVRI